MKNLAVTILFRAIYVVMSTVVCAFVFLAVQPTAFGQWKLATGFSNSFGFYNYDLPTGFIAWGNSMLAHAACWTDPSLPGAPPDSLFVSMDNGQTWTDLTSGVLPVFISGTGANAVFYNNINGALSYSSDEGQTWVADSTGLNAQGWGVGTASSMVAIGSNIYLSNPFGVFKQTSLGSVWSPDYSGLGLTIVVPLGQVGSIISTGSNLFLNTGWYGVYLSSNSGTWSSASNGLPLLTINGVQRYYPANAFATSGSEVFAQVAHDTDMFGGADLYSSDFYRTADNGMNWTKMNSAPLNNWGATYGFTAASTALFALVLFAVTDSGFYASTDRGATWTQHNDGLPLAPGNYTNSIQVSQGTVMIGTQSSGVYYRSSSDFGGAGIASSTNAVSGLNLTLSENPIFSSEEKISYTMLNPGPAEIMLMDELGRTAKVLWNGRASAGKNSLSFDPQSLALGTYFIRIEAEGMSAMQKLVIVK